MAEASAQGVDVLLAGWALTDAGSPRGFNRLRRRFLVLRSVTEREAGGASHHFSHLIATFKTDTALATVRPSAVVLLSRGATEVTEVFRTISRVGVRPFLLVRTPGSRRAVCVAPGGL